MSKRIVQILAAPETNLFLFAFLLNFVYEVWQAPYYEFYQSPSLADKINDLTHCSFGDGVIILFSSWVVSVLVRSRNWVLYPTSKLAFLFISIGLAITLVIETYEVKTKTSNSLTGTEIQACFTTRFRPASAQQRRCRVF